MEEKVKTTRTRTKKGTSSKTKATVGKKIKNESDNGLVEFSFYGPDAQHVFLVGDFNNWDISSLPMKRDKNNYWKTKIELSPGRYQYKFFADGNWVEDIPNAEKAQNSYGTPNFVITV
ncbi:MAG: isoamylase early set domain-containing protein [bacterium]